MNKWGAAVGVETPSSLIPPGSYRVKLAEVKALPNYTGVTVKFSIEVEGEERFIWRILRWVYEGVPIHLTLGYRDLKHLCKLLGTPEGFNPKASYDFDPFLGSELNVDISIESYKERLYNRIDHIYG